MQTVETETIREENIFEHFLVLENPCDIKIKI